MLMRLLHSAVPHMFLWSQIDVHVHTQPFSFTWRRKNKCFSAVSEPIFSTLNQAGAGFILPGLVQLAFLWNLVFLLLLKGLRE